MKVFSYTLSLKNPKSELRSYFEFVENGHDNQLNFVLRKAFLEIYVML